MGACLCKSRRRPITAGAAAGEPAGLFRRPTSGAPVNCSSAASTASTSSAASSSASSAARAPASNPSHQHSRQQAARAGRLTPASVLEALALAGATQLEHSLYASLASKQAGAGGEQFCASAKRPSGCASSSSTSSSSSSPPPPALPSQRLWSLQNKLAQHADRLVVETLESIKPTALSEPSNAMQKLHLISETELGWLVVIQALINKVDLEHPFGSALILLILEDAPLPTKKSIQQLDEVLNLAAGCGGGGAPTNLAGSVARQRNTSIVLGCLAEKLAGTFSSALFTPAVQDFLMARIEPARNEPVVVLFSLIALEKFSQTTDNKLAIMRRLGAMGAQNPLLRLEKLMRQQQQQRFSQVAPRPQEQVADAFIELQVGFCATWDLDNHFLYEGRPYSYEIIERDNLNVMLNARDASENLKISADGLMARNDTSRFESVRSTSAITSGLYYYEVQLITPGVMQIGFATKQSKFLNHDGFGIGDDDQSFAYDGCRQLLWQNAKSSHAALPRWREGDIVGCLIDLDRFEIRFSLNGQMSQPNSDLFRNKPLSTQYYAAASFMPFQQCAFNFGRVPFVYPPEFHNFRTLNQCAQLRDEDKLIMPRHLLIKRINLGLSVSANPTSAAAAAPGSPNLTSGGPHSTSSCSPNSHSNSSSNSSATTNQQANNSFVNACNICCDNAARVTLEPCEHDGLCETCASLLDLCPMCRTTIAFRRIS